MKDYSVECYIYDETTSDEINILECFKSKEELQRWSHEKEEQAILELYNVVTKIQ